MRARAYCTWSAVLIGLFTTFCDTSAQPSGTVELFAGTSWSLPLPLTIAQPGEPIIQFRARYSTRPLRDAPYYAYRVTAFSGGRGLGAELIHHKIYLENPPPEIERFEVSHGYNLVLGSYAAHNSGLTWRVGVGVVIAHPEGRVRTDPVGPVRSFLGGGYHIAGITAQLGVGRGMYLGSGFFVQPEFKITGSAARVPLAGGGYASVPNIAVHALGGLGYVIE